MAGRGSGALVGFGLLAAVGLIGLSVVLAVKQAAPGPANVPAITVHEEFPNAWPSAPPPSVARLLDGAGPGTALGEKWRIRGVSPVHEQRIVIDVANGSIGFRVLVMLKERDARLPPKQTERYSLYTVQPRPRSDSVDDKDYDLVLKALGERIAKQEKSVPVPDGL
ncbi:MAG: hypothetical protein IPI67_13800 [Myxococcales bacterium]|nr:hypothetical protein [Myxococcales bacterium]